MASSITQYKNQIDWEALEKTIKNCAMLDSTHEKLIFEIGDPKKIQRKLDITEHFIEVLQSEEFNTIKADLLQFYSDFDFKSILNKIKISSLVEITDLNQIILSLEFGQSFNHYPVKYFPHLKVEKNNIRKTIQDFRKFIDVEGNIDFEKHPQLRPLYQKLKEHETKIRVSLERLIRDPEFQNNLQIPQHDIINDYFVLPIKSDHYQSRFGKIVSRSDSGKTLFVEPTNISQANAERLGFVLEIEKIISKIESEFISKLNSHWRDTENSVATVLFVDEYLARADFSFKYNYFKPHLSPTPYIDVKKAHHPLIKNSIPNDIKIGPGEGLIISGPNTGGKTASLKLIALYITLLKRGFYIPAAEATLHPYSNIFFLGQDLQNLEEGLSSFASEIKSYQDLMSSLGETNLILIDEIFNSTASEEASALAYSLLKSLNKGGENTILVSTHHQTLKQYLHNDEEFISAHVGFNDQTNQPTYKLIYGNPGSSYAIEIFSEMAKDSPVFEKILDNAKNYIDTNVVHYEKMLSDLSRKKAQLDKVIQDNRQLQLELKNQKQAQESIFAIKLQQKMTEALSEIEEIKDKAESILIDVKKGNITNRNKVANKFAEIKGRLKSDDEKKPQKELNYEKPKELTVGSRYFCVQLNKDVELLEIKKSKVKVLAGKMKVEVPAKSLRLSGNGSQKVKKEVYVHTSFVNDNKKLEYDCRGMRLSEFQNLVEQIISDLYGHSMPFANVIHGHGDGVLKKWLRDYIKRHPDFTIANNESGNDGESRIELI